MPRRRVVQKREIPADPLYQSALVTKFINTIMSEGKRSTAERIVSPPAINARGSRFPCTATSCGSGVSACQNALGMRVAG